MVIKKLCFTPLCGLLSSLLLYHSIIFLQGFAAHAKSANNNCVFCVAFLQFLSCRDSVSLSQCRLRLKISSLAAPSSSPLSRVAWWGGGEETLRSGPRVFYSTHPAQNSHFSIPIRPSLIFISVLTAGEERRAERSWRHPPSPLPARARETPPRAETQAGRAGRRRRWACTGTAGVLPSSPPYGRYGTQEKLRKRSCIEERERDG